MVKPKFKIGQEVYIGADRIKGRVKDINGDRLNTNNPRWIYDVFSEGSTIIIEEGCLYPEGVTFPKWIPKWSGEWFGDEICWPKPSEHSFREQLFKQQEGSKMRKLVDVQLIDNDKGLDVEYALVWEGSVMTEDNVETTIRELLMSTDIDDSIAQHNILRQEQTDQEILTKTGNTVNLRPIKLKDLTWMVDGKAV